MATRTRQLRVEIVGDPRHIMRTFDSIEKSTGRMSRGVSRFGTLAAAGLAAFAGGKVVGAIKSMVDEAREAERVGKTTEARLKSTGGVAGITAKQIEKLSTALSNKLGIDDEIIQSGANMMLTFKGVRDAAGRNNDIFTQATKLSVDLAAGMHQGQVTAEGLQGANIQLGKALENPVKGITALTRVGVTFTQAQRDQIKTLVESGHTLEAQKIILKAVGDQFAGSAEAATDPWKRIGVILGNVKELIGTALLPILDRTATFITERFIPAAERFWKEHGPKFREIIRQIGELFSTKVGPAIRDFAENQGPRLAAILVRVGTFITKTVIPALAGMARWLNEHKTLAQSVAVGILAIIAAVKVWAAVTKTMAAVQVILNIALAANPVGLVILAIAALAAGIIYAYKHSKTFRDVVSKVFDFIRDKIATVVNFIIGVIRGWLNIQIGVVLGILRVMGKLPGPMGEPFRKAEEAVKKAKKTINDEIDKIQAKVNKLRGKDIPISVSLKLNFTSSFTQKDWVQVRLAAGRMAEGGRLPGYGGGDRVPILAEPGEAVVDKVRTRRFAPVLAAMGVPGFAAGGPVGEIDRESTAINRVQARGTGARIDRGITKLLSMFSARPPHAAGGWQFALNFLRALGIDYNVISTFRPGARTRASGSVSYHALNRAVDLTGNMMAIFNALARTNPTELIFSHAPRYKSRSGWHDISRLDPITFMDHLSHVHAAYDKGGLLMPGRTLAINRTGAPELVMPPARLYGPFSDALKNWVVPWLRRIAAGVEGGGGGIARGAAAMATVSRSTAKASKLLTAWQLNSLPDAQRWAYVGRYGHPKPPAGYVWAEDHSLVPTSFYNRTSYDRGGWLPPGTSLATNRTGRAERVLGPGEGAGIVVNFHGPVYGDKRALTETVRQGIREALRREGKPVTV